MVYVCVRVCVRVRGRVYVRGCMGIGVTTCGRLWLEGERVGMWVGCREAVSGVTYVYGHCLGPAFTAVLGGRQGDPGRQRRLLATAGARVQRAIGREGVR